MNRRMGGGRRGRRGELRMDMLMHNAMSESLRAPPPFMSRCLRLPGSSVLYGDEGECVESEWHVRSSALYGEMSSASGVLRRCWRYVTFRVAQVRPRRLCSTGMT